ncbi:hypothetical protein PI87_16375 [Ralstonia sp. A12]|uniref:hypothetical protein n=1 Tax=Ralstonia sp. A12 TaxID=1217052 RepID=UPI0005745265|nr:hypothetical protein [Ralstonia sp. A12]KHK54096.1 hypothetical protein PI87_16375 [Ralstonia sp. A12]
MSKQTPLGTIAPEIRAGLTRYIDHSLNCCVEPDGRKTILSGPEIGSLFALDRFVWSALATPFAPFRISGTMHLASEHEQGAPHERYSSERWKYTKSASPNPYCQDTLDLAAQLQRISHYAETFDPSKQAAAQLEHAPHLRLLLDTFFHHPIQNCGGSDINSPTVHGGLIKAEICNNFVAQFRQAMLARKFLRRERHNWHMGCRENLTNLRAYLGGLFTRHQSLTVLHLRLFHAKNRASLISAPVEDQHQDLRELRACRNVFFDRMRRKPALFTQKPGYVWAILPSLEGGYDLHLTLLFDSVALCKVLDDKRVEAEQAGTILEDHADQIGAYWVRTATAGEGGYLRGDKNGWLYGPDWVHGEVCADDVGRREKLQETLGYLPMRRALVRLKNEPEGEYFGMREGKSRAPRRSARQTKTDS